VKYCKGSGLVNNNNNDDDDDNLGAVPAPRNRTGRECLIVCLWGYVSARERMEERDSCVD
jgi:hypothetical protein